MRPFAVYPASFDGSTLGLWRFGERGGRLDGVIGPDFTNFGAEPLDDGYRFVHTEGDTMNVAFPGQPARTQLTLECWVRDVTILRGPASIYQNLLGWWRDDDNYILLRIILCDDPTQSRINAYGKIGGVVFINVSWISEDFDDLVSAPNPWHVAVSMNDAGLPRHRLFVNGVQRDTGWNAMSWLAGDYAFTLGKDSRGNYNYFGGVLDEVRLSTAARYAADFPIARFQDGRRAVLRGPEMQAGVCAGVIQ